jgi:excisionase family DNA binding protein
MGMPAVLSKLHANKQHGGCVMKAVRNGCPDVGLSDGLESGESLLPKLGWTLYELAQSLGVSVPFLRLEVKRGKLHAARLGRRVVLLDAEVRRYLAEASDRAA